MVEDFEPQKISLTVDIVVFTVMNNDLKILLIKRGTQPFKGMWAIPGGFVHTKEELHQAALRELQEETGVKDIFLRKLTAYGKVGRDPRGRIVSIVYMALIDGEKVKLQATTDAEHADWFSVYSMPKLAFDHKMIIDETLKELRYEIQTTNIAYQLLPEKFTLTEMQKAYEVILDKELDKRNFRKRISALEILKSLNETKMEGAHRPAQLFNFLDKKYKPLKEKVQVFL